MANDGQRVSLHFRNLPIDLMLRLKAEKRLPHMTGPDLSNPNLILRSTVSRQNSESSMLFDNHPSRVFPSLQLQPHNLQDKRFRERVGGCYLVIQTNLITAWSGELGVSWTVWIGWFSLSVDASAHHYTSRWRRVFCRTSGFDVYHTVEKNRSANILKK